MVNIIYKIAWAIWFILIFFFRESSISKYIIVLLVIPLCIIAVRRAINVREDWRPIAEEYHKDLEE